MAAVTLAAELRTAQTAAQAQAEAWKQQTVGDFFARCNWENIEIPVLESAVPSQAVVLDYSLSVRQFFGAIPWEGGAMPVAISAQASSNLAQLEPALELPSFEGNSSSDELPELEEIADESHLDGGDVTLDDFLGSFSL